MGAHDGVEVKDHLEKDTLDECAYCGQFFSPDEVVVEKALHGRKWRFCNEECYRDFLDASNFKDQDMEAEQELLTKMQEIDEEDKETI